MEICRRNSRGFDKKRLSKRLKNRQGIFLLSFDYSVGVDFIEKNS